MGCLIFLIVAFWLYLCFWVLVALLATYALLALGIFFVGLMVILGLFEGVKWIRRKI